MKTLYYVIKSSRVSYTPYQGPACERAGVSPGVYFVNLEDAQEAAQKLTEANPVGFDVRFANFNEVETEDSSKIVPWKRSVSLEEWKDYYNKGYVVED